jgi:tetratricopeptide (TPR) repeat protein
MSFVFRAFTKSRRKKNKVRSSAAEESIVSGISSRPSEDSDFSALHDVYKNVKRPQRVMVGSQTDEEDDDRTHPLNEQSPSHCSNTSSSAASHPTAAPQTPHNNSKHGRRTVGTLYSTAISTEPSKRHLFKSLRRKSDPNNSQAQHTTPLQQTPETTTTSSQASPLTPDPQHKSPPTVKRGMQNRFSEIYTPSQTVPRKLTFQDVPNNHNNTDAGPPATAPLQRPRHSKTSDTPLPPVGKRFSELKRGKRSKPIETFGTTKTLIMNGDIVVCPSHTSSDTATTVSAASSKARALRREAERIARAAAQLDNKGNELFERGHFDKAMSCYSKALKLKRRTFAHLLEEADDMEDQLVMCEENKADPQILVSMATSINNIGYLRQRSGDATPDETMAAYKKSLKIKRRILGNDSLSVGKTLNNIGSVYYLKREFDQALPAYHEALHIMKANLGDKHPDVATVMSNIGDVHLGQGNPDTSLLKYRQALAIRWECFGERDPRVIRLLEKIAKVEIGDRMLMPSRSTDESQSAWGDDAASEVLVDAPRPISDELKNLQQQIAKDIEHVDSMERKATVELLKDRIVIIRGMRAIWEGHGPELLDNDTASIRTSGQSMKM